MVLPSDVIVGSKLPNSSFGGNGSFLGISSLSAAAARLDRAIDGSVVAAMTVPDVRRNCLRETALMIPSLSRTCGSVDRDPQIVGQLRYALHPAGHAETPEALARRAQMSHDHRLIAPSMMDLGQ